MTPDPFRQSLAERTAALLLGDLPLPEEALLAFADALHDLETAAAVARAGDSACPVAELVCVLPRAE